MKQILLTVVSQEQQLLKTQVEQITAPTAMGEITILPEHIGLFSKLQTGELKYLINDKEESMVISDGFITVSPDSTVTVMVDVAKFARDISVQKAEDAVKAAKETIKASPEDRRELLMAEASLKRALLEIRIAQKSKKSRI
jgi:F-type H+-transporting ATPase subunit epsilon